MSMQKTDFCPRKASLTKGTRIFWVQLQLFTVMIVNVEELVRERVWPCSIGKTSETGCLFSKTVCKMWTFSSSQEWNIIISHG